MKNLFALILVGSCLFAPCQDQNADKTTSLLKAAWGIDENAIVPDLQGKEHPGAKSVDVGVQLEVDVAMDANSAIMGFHDFGEGFAAPSGAPFAVRGYIYPAGTLEANGSNGGVNEDGSAQWPDLVMGIWVCRGWLFGLPELKVGAPTTLLFNFTDGTGAHIVLDGNEPGSFAPVLRSVTGGTGQFAWKRGQCTQRIVSINTTGVPNFKFQFSFHPNFNFKK